MSSGKECQICKKDDFKYKCPKCGIKYCSLACYKNEELHIHKDAVTTELKTEQEDKTSAKDKTESSEIKFKTEKYQNIYDNSPEIRELLNYNTVKFHLAKVHKILTTTVADFNDSTTSMSSEAKKQLAIDYLNTLRYGGIHYNEALEEFCQLTVAKLHK